MSNDGLLRRMFRQNGALAEGDEGFYEDTDRVADSASDTPAGAGTSSVASGHGALGNGTLSAASANGASDRRDAPSHLSVAASRDRFDAELDDDDLLDLDSEDLDDEDDASLLEAIDDSDLDLAETPAQGATVTPIATGHGNTDATAARADDTEDDLTGDMARPRPSPADLERARQRKLVEQTARDIDSLDDNMTQNAFHLNHSREQLRTLRAFVKQADVEFEEVHRLRDSVSKLTVARDHAAQSSERTRRELEQTKAALVASQSRNTEFRKALEKARTDILSLMEADREQREEIDDLHAHAEQREAEVLEANRLADKLLADSRTLKENNERLANDLSAAIKTNTELEKRLQETNGSVSHWKREADRATTELRAVSDKLDQAQTDNASLTSRLESAEAEMAELERASDDKVRIREDELFSLKSRIDALRSELRVKTETATRTGEELRAARSEAKVAKEQVEDLSQQLAAETAQREGDRQKLIEANAEIADVNDRFSELLADLERSRRETMLLKRRIKIERQKTDFSAEMRNSSVADEIAEPTPEPKPEPAAPKRRRSTASSRRTQGSTSQAR